jgi:outer membrane protein assembly factor BamB
MQTIEELHRRPSPGSRPQPLAFDGSTLWVGSWETDHLYALDPQTWAVTDEVAAPGKPYGLAAFGGELRVVVSIGDDDDRYLFRFVPGKGFDPDSKVACPDYTGSHLVTDGTTLYLGQMGNRRIVALDESGSIQREIALPSRCVGLGFGSGGFHIIACDEEFENLYLAKIDLETDTPALIAEAAIPFDARCLAFDGTAWWTSQRESSQIVAFTV